VRDLTTKFGENAGKIWSVLNEEGCLKKKKLLKITQLNDDDFFTGVGWLAKENKLSKEDKDCFKLDSTNLESEIGAHAGKIWKILDIWGDADFTTIKRLSDLEDDEVHAAIGWLAREDKICVDGKQRYNLK
jgi:hypothetical protein